MFSPQRQRDLFSPQNLTDGISTDLECCGMVEIIVVKCWTSIYSDIDRRTIEFLVIEFYLARCIQDCLRSMSSPFHITNTIFEWRRDNCITCIFWLAIWCVWCSKLSYCSIIH